MNEIKSLGNGTIIAFRCMLTGWQNIFTRQKKFLSMPILAGENLFAVMNLSHRDTKQAFDSNDERNLSIMTGELGLALENARLHSSVEECMTNIQECGEKLSCSNEKLQKENTKSKNAEAAVTESEGLFKSLGENAPDIIYTLDMDGLLTYVNPAWENILGYKKEEVIGKYLVDYASKEDAKGYFQTFKRMRDHEETIGDATVSLLDRDGDVRLFKASCSPNFNSEGKMIGAVGVLKDITQQRRLEVQLQQSQKMEAIGTLAGGITHDFNNILSAILGYTELAILDAKDERKIRQHLEKIQGAGNRARDLVNQILAFSRQTKQERFPVQLSSIVKEALKMLRASLPSTIEIRQKIQAEQGPVEADSTQIHQVLMNLCTNAAHAMQENGGILEIGIQNVDFGLRSTDYEKGKKQTTLGGHASDSTGQANQVSESQIEYLDVFPGPYLKLTVRDTGIGMTPDVLRRIFDPYFTTKEKAHGTGLGLSVVHGIIKSHGGSITVESEPGQGTTFHVYLPRMEYPKRKGDKMAASPHKGIPTGHERILFVDDEQALVDIGRQMLEHLGYELITRTNSIEALELFKAEPDGFDLVITDMTMPNMTGEKLARAMMKIRPDIPIILCTGFSERITEKNAGKIGIRKLAMKPLAMRDLAEAIREVLGN
jgi:PAS domain S-box-containing protein